MKITILIFCSFLFSCNFKDAKPAKEQNIRQEIFDRDFKDCDVVSIDIVEIEHPMLGGIKKSIKLNNDQQNKFLKNFNKLEKKGVLKCRSTYVIRINFNKDTIRLKACGSNISNRYNDMYFHLPNDENIIKEYL